MSKSQEQVIAKKFQETLKELGYNVKLGHCYELISKAVGFKNWDTYSGKIKSLTKTKDVLEMLVNAEKFTHNINEVTAVDDYSPNMDNTTCYEFKLKCLAEIKPKYEIYAKSVSEAFQILSKQLENVNLAELYADITYLETPLVVEQIHSQDQSTKKFNFHYNCENANDVRNGLSFTDPDDLKYLKSLNKS